MYILHPALWFRFETEGDLRRFWIHQKDDGRVGVESFWDVIGQFETRVGGGYLRQPQHKRCKHSVIASLIVVPQKNYRKLQSSFTRHCTLQLHTSQRNAVGNSHRLLDRLNKSSNLVYPQRRRNMSAGFTAYFHSPHHIQKELHSS